MKLSQKLADLPPRTLAALVVGSITLVATVSMSALYHVAVTHKEEALRQHVRDLAIGASGFVDVARHEQLTRPEQYLSSDYLRVLAPLLKIHRSHAGIQYLWTVRVGPGGGQTLVLETSVDEIVRREQEALGRQQDLLPFLGPNSETERGLESLPLLRAGEAWVFPGIYEDEHGSYIEARAPLFDAQHQFVGYVGVDFALDSFYAEVNTVRVAGAISLLCALALSGVLARSSYLMREQSIANLRAAQEARDRADRANHEKGEILAIASHDLKNPLSSIAGMSSLLLRQKRPSSSPEAAEEVEVLESINSAARHMSEIVRGLLLNEGFDQGAMTLERRDCDLVALCEDVLRLNRPAAARKGQALTFNHPPQLHASVDAKLLREACDNYVSNAVKYSPRGRPISVRLEALAAGGFEFAVQDEGPGLSAEDQAQLFQKFRRLTPRPTGSETSTGLGLSIVKTIAEAHGGSVGCESAPGQGARFWLRCPTTPG